MSDDELDEALQVLADESAADRLKGLREQRTEALMKLRASVASAAKRAGLVVAEDGKVSLARRFECALHDDGQAATLPWQSFPDRVQRTGLPKIRYNVRDKKFEGVDPAPTACPLLASPCLAATRRPSLPKRS